MNQFDSTPRPTAPLTIVYQPLAALRPDPRNARTHPKRQISQIVASIRAFGFTNPILTDEAGLLIAGHGRLLAAKELGLTEVPVIVLAGLSDPQKRALRLADNKIALNAGWDLEILQMELAELASMDVDIDPALTGFSVGEIDVILKSSVDPDDEAGHCQIKIGVADDWIGVVPSECPVASASPTSEGFSLKVGYLLPNR